MKLPNLSQLESESLMRDQMKAVKGGDGGTLNRYDICQSYFCPFDENDPTLEVQTYLAALLSSTQPEPDD